MGKKRNKSNNVNVGVEEETDMVDELLAFYSHETRINESADLQNSIKLTRDNIKAIIMVSSLFIDICSTFYSLWALFGTKTHD